LPQVQHLLGPDCQGMDHVSLLKHAGFHTCMHALCLAMIIEMNAHEARDAHAHIMHQQHNRVFLVTLIK